MARTRGTKSSSPSAQKPTPREVPVQASTSEPPRSEVVPPPVKPTPKKRQAKPTLQTPPARRYFTRSGGRPLQKRARVESSEPIDLTGQSPVPSPEPSPVPPPAPSAKPQASQPPPPEPQIQSATAPEAIIRRPMLTQPPIEGNFDCRARPFHSELCFDTAVFQLRPELEGLFQLLRRHHMEQLLTPRDFFYPRVAMDFYQSMTTQ
ncbi:anther-specific proline-rich protein APG-like [Vitis riparia]|uniref:anther-specific proline-rich protein APG-like n=1 Tax=Vitis riparia TaxID=96939 RepID=UPI00155AF0E6|nr:anther-specific proline-rich protein APG-like [Vitis riparia]